MSAGQVVRRIDRDARNDGRNYTRDYLQGALFDLGQQGSSTAALSATFFVPLDRLVRDGFERKTER
jgi:hypothetical protein